MRYTPKINEFIKQNLITPDKHPALYDYQFQLHLADAPWKEWLSQPNYFDINEEYIEEFKKWINKSKNNSITGLECFSKTDVIIGTTQAFDEAYFRYRNRRLRIFHNEYGYHNRNINCTFLDDNGNYIPLEDNDWVILSVPFSGTGNIALYQNMLLTDAYQKNIPVLIDCAWFGTCRNINFDFTNPAITEVVFSLSKGIGLGNMRTGLRFSNYQDGYIRQQNNYKHLVKSNMQLGLWQMNKFSPDYVTDKYIDAYKKMCKDLDIQQTWCMHVAGYNGKLLGVRNLVKKYYKNIDQRRIIV